MLMRPNKARTAVYGWWLHGLLFFPLSFCWIYWLNCPLHIFFQSCPVGRGPEFSRCVFDVYGHSPLVEQFLRMQKLAKDSGTSVLIQRTEIKSLPPYPSQYCQNCFLSARFKDGVLSGRKLSSSLFSHLSHLWLSSEFLLWINLCHAIGSAGWCN